MTINKRPIFQPSIELQRIKEFLRARKFKPGDSIPVAEIAKELNITEECVRNRYATLEKHLREEDQLSLKQKHKSICCLTPHEANDRAKHDVIESTRRRARKSIKRMGIIPFASLGKEDQHQFNVTATLASLQLHFTKSGSVKQIAGKVQAAQQKLPLDATIAAFLGTEKKET